MKKWNEKYHDKFKRHSLSGQLWGMQNLEKAWKKVRANRGSAGIDRESIGYFGAQLEQNLAEIQRLLKQDRYQPQPVKRVYIPKSDGRQRPLGIPTVADRIAQMVVKQSMEPILEPHFHEDSYGIARASLPLMRLGWPF